MMILRRWSWIVVLPLALVAGAMIVRFTYLQRDVRRELGDELSAPLDVARIEIENWNRLHPGDSASITDSTFSFLRGSGRIVESRTTLLARGRDSITVLASATRDTVSLRARSFVFDSAPRHVRSAFSTRRKTGGTGEGLVYDQAIYTAAPIRGTSWVVIREVDAYPLVERMLLPLAIDVAFVASLFLFAFAYVRSQVRMNGMKREQELSQVRADFLTAVSHELRTPLAQIRMFAELLRRGSMRRPEEMGRAVGVIEKESSRLSILVDNVLNHARLRRERDAAIVDQHHSTDVNRDIEYVLDAFAPLANEKEVKLVSSSEVVSLANVDSQALRQLLLNFLENAVKYGPRGQTVTAGASKSGAKVRVWVDDEGPGVPEGERDVIWTAFARGTVGVGSKTGGSGIGLSVVRDLAAEHGGRVWVEEAASGGARFVAEFEVAADERLPGQDRDADLRAASVN